jgi:hypothetical protein
VNRRDEPTARCPPTQEPAQEQGKSHGKIESEDPDWIANQGSQQGTEANAVVGTGQSYGGCARNSTFRAALEAVAAPPDSFQLWR